MTPKIGRDEAKAKGLNRYFTGNLCRHGHVSERYVSNGLCVLCHKAGVPRIVRKVRLENEARGK